MLIVSISAIIEKSDTAVSFLALTSARRSFVATSCTYDSPALTLVDFRLHEINPGNGKAGFSKLDCER